jgi:hypothetical protein
MARTLLDGDAQIEDATIAKKDLVTNFMASQDWDVTEGAKDATFIHLKDAVESHSPATLGQLEAAVASINASLNSFLEYQGGLDASNSTAFEAAAHSKGDFYKITVSGSIEGVEANAGDNLYFKNDVLAGSLVAGDFDIVDNTEAANIIRISDIIDNLTTTSVEKPLSANQGYVLKGLIDLLGSRVKAEKIGEKLVATQSSPILPPLANVPIAGTVRMYRNGSRMDEGSGEDFTVNYTTGVITYEFNLKSRDKIICDYKYEY